MPSGSKKRAKQKAAKTPSFKGTEDLPSPKSDEGTTPQGATFPPASASSGTDNSHPKEAPIQNGVAQDTPKEQPKEKPLEPIVEKEATQPAPAPAVAEAPAPPAAEPPAPSTPETEKEFAAVSAASAATQADTTAPQVTETKDTEEAQANSSQAVVPSGSTSVPAEETDKNQLTVIAAEPDAVSCSGLMCWLFFPKGARPGAGPPAVRPRS